MYISAGHVPGIQDMEHTVVTACRQVGQKGQVCGRSIAGQRDSEDSCPHSGPLPRRIDLCLFIGAEVSLGPVLGCCLQGGTPGSGRWDFCPQPCLLLVFLSKAADLTAIIGEKEQSLQEKTEVILQKEQEILQLKKGEEPVPG